MTTIEDDQLEAEIPELAVEALTAAHRRAIQAGHTLVLVKGGELIRMKLTDIVVLKKIPARKKVTFRTKNAKP